MTFRPALAMLTASLLLVAGPGCRSKPAGASAEGAPSIEVVEEGTGRPLPGIELEILDGGRLVAAGSSDSNGRLTLAHEIRDFVHVRFRDPSGTHLCDESELDLASGRRLSLPTAVNVLLPVLDASGVPIASWTVTGWSPRGRPRLLQGSPGAPVGPLGEGPVKLVISAPGHESAVIDARIKAEKSTGVAAIRPVRLGKGGGRLSGRVQPAPQGAGIEAVLRYSGAGQIAAVDGSGAFEVEGFPVRPGGKALLVLRQGNRELYAREVDLSLGSIDAGVIFLDE